MAGMTKKLIAGVLAALAFIGVQAFGAREAECAICVYSGTCYSSSICGRGCLCLKKGTETGGSCYAVEAMPADGVVLP